MMLKNVEVSLENLPVNDCWVDRPRWARLCCCNKHPKHLGGLTLIYFSLLVYIQGGATGPFFIVGTQRWAYGGSIPNASMVTMVRGKARW